MGTPIRNLTEDTSLASGDMLVVDKATPLTTRKFTLSTLASYLLSLGTFGGEINTASNVGTAGTGLFDNKTGADLRFRKLNAASAKVSVTLDSGNQKVDIDVPDASTSAKGAVQLATPSSDTTAGHVVQASDARLSDARTPLSHTHNASDINAGTLAASRLPSATTSTQGATILATPSSDTTAGHVIQASDTRLSDSRTPSGTASGDLGSTYPSPQVVATHLTAPLPVNQGGTGTASLSADQLLLGSGTSALRSLGAGSLGDVLTSNGAGADPSFSPLLYFAHVLAPDHTISAGSAGDGVSLANGKGISITSNVGANLITVSTIPPIYKSTNETINNSATLQSDDQLVFTAASGKKYSFVFRVYIADNSTSALGGIKAALGGTATYTNLISQAALYGNSALVILDLERLTSAGQIVSGTSDIDLYLEINGTVEINTGGTFELQWAQATATGLGSGVTVLRGSTLEHHELNN